MSKYRKQTAPTDFEFSLESAEMLNPGPGSGDQDEQAHEPTESVQQQEQPAAPQEPAVVVNDAWMSLEEFKREVVPQRVTSVAFAGFAHAMRPTKRHNFRREWRSLLNQYLQCEGFTK